MVNLRLCVEDEDHKRYRKLKRFFRRARKFLGHVEIWQKGLAVFEKESRSTNKKKSSK